MDYLIFITKRILTRFDSKCISNVCVLNEMELGSSRSLFIEGFGYAE
jgi:hypothetical protein